MLRLIQTHYPRLAWHLFMPGMVLLLPRSIIPVPFDYIEAGWVATLCFEAMIWAFGFGLEDARNRHRSSNRFDVADPRFGLVVALMLAILVNLIERGLHRDAKFVYASILWGLDFHLRVIQSRRRSPSCGVPKQTPPRPWQGLLRCYTPRIVCYGLVPLLTLYGLATYQLLAGYFLVSLTLLVGMRRFILNAGVDLLKVADRGDRQIAVFGTFYKLGAMALGLGVLPMVGVVMGRDAWFIYGDAMLLAVLELRLWQGEMVEFGRRFAVSIAPAESP